MLMLALTNPTPMYCLGLAPNVLRPGSLHSKCVVSAIVEHDALACSGLGHVFFKGMEMVLSEYFIWCWQHRNGKTSADRQIGKTGDWTFKN